MTTAIKEWQPRLLWRMLGFEPHPGQEEMLRRIDAAVNRIPGAPRFLDAATGRQWGKTMTAEVALWQALLGPNDDVGPPSLVLVSDTYEHTNLVWDRFVQHAFGVEMLRALVDKYDREREIITLKSGARLQKLSADRPQGLTGFTLTGAVIDESAFVADEAIEMLLPCLAVRQGFILAVGTAEGQGWHRTWFLRGQDPNYVEHWSAEFPSTNSPYFPPTELETQRLMLPRRRWEQLYLAHWQSEDGAMFHGIENCWLDAPVSTPSTPNRGYVIGADFARSQDFTAMYVGDARTGRILHEERFTARDWMDQIEVCDRLAKAYNGATVFADATGVGDAVVAMLRDKGVDVVPVVMTQPVKDRLVSRLVVAIEREDLHWPKEYTQLNRELMVFETRVLSSGRVQTGAPPGFHDDCVMALSLVNEGLNRGYGGLVRTATEELW